ncbi:uncharacterized protein LOC113937613 [Zalophus californianus]|uniref:Uncharacterized protein LOC113937613 n=1 Tax=Zalophus californianus TaxID=9704 RepID=A0A6P9FCL1_ZALCA|nr:uncharacterized protein LOC113937613 [Zalophus californianus]
MDGWNDGKIKGCPDTWPLRFSPPIHEEAQRDRAPGFSLGDAALGRSPRPRCISARAGRTREGVSCGCSRLPERSRTVPNRPEPEKPHLLAWFSLTPPTTVPAPWAVRALRLSWEQMETVPWTALRAVPQAAALSALQDPDPQLLMPPLCAGVRPAGRAALDLEIAGGSQRAWRHWPSQDERSQLPWRELLMIMLGLIVDTRVV